MKNIVTHLLYWPPSQKGGGGHKSLGHTALKITPLEDKKTGEIPNQWQDTYISYYPDPRSNCFYFFCPITPVFRTFSEDVKSAQVMEEIRGRYVDSKSKGPDDLEVIEIKNLDEEKMIDYFINLKDRSSFWCLFSECFPSRIKENYSCSYLTSKVLIAGGIQKQLPFYERFGSFGHLWLLASSRIVVASSLMASGLYPILQEKVGGSESEAFLGAIMLIIFNFISLFILEKIYKNKFNQKSLIEINMSDCFIGAATSVGFSIYPLLHRRWLTPILYAIPLWSRILCDMGVMFVGSLVGVFTFGKLASWLVVLLGGTGYLNHPRNVRDWIVYINKMQDIDPEIKQHIFKKERLFLSIAYIGFLSCYVIRKLGFDRETAMYIGIPLGIVLNGLLMTYPNEWRKNKILALLTEQAPVQRALTEEFIKPYMSSLIEYSCTCLGSTLGMMLAITLFENIPIGAIAAGACSVVGSVPGYLVGKLVSEGIKKIFPKLSIFHKNMPLKVALPAPEHESAILPRLNSPLSPGRYSALPDSPPVPTLL